MGEPESSHVSRAGESEDGPNGEDLERRGGCPECSEWRERDQVAAEGTIWTMSK